MNAQSEKDKDLQEHIVMDLAYQMFRKEAAVNEPDLSRQEILERWEEMESTKKQVQFN